MSNSISILIKIKHLFLQFLIPKLRLRVFLEYTIYIKRHKILFLRLYVFFVGKEEILTFSETRKWRDPSDVEDQNSPLYRIEEMM